MNEPRLELEVIPGQPSQHRIIMAGTIDLLNYPGVHEALAAADDSRLLTKAALARVGLDVSPLLRERAEFAELVREGARFIIAFRWGAPQGESTPIMVHRLPFPPFTHALGNGTLTSGSSASGSSLEAPSDIQVVGDHPQVVSTGYALIHERPASSRKARKRP